MHPIPMVAPLWDMLSGRTPLVALAIIFVVVAFI